MHLQFSEGRWLKSTHLFHRLGEGQHGRRVAAYRAGFAVLAACFHPGWEGSSALHGTGRAARGPSACLRPMAGVGQTWQMSFLGAEYLCCLETHPAQNRNNRQGSGFKALVQTLNWHYSLKITESVQSKTKILQLLRKALSIHSPRRISQMLNLSHLCWNLSYFPNSLLILDITPIWYL